MYNYIESLIRFYIICAVLGPDSMFDCFQFQWCIHMYLFAVALLACACQLDHMSVHIRVGCAFSCMHGSVSMSEQIKVSSYEMY